MKKVFLLLFISLFIFDIQAQAPEKIKFQAVARNASNQPITTPVEVRLSVLEGSDVGPAIYVDEQIVNPNSNGLFASNLGDGPVTGTLNGISWSSNDYYLKAEIRETIAGGYEQIGAIQQILSVPYALYGKDEDADPNNELQTLSLSGNNLTLSNGGGSVTVDTDPNNELQTLALSGNNLTMSNGGGSITIDGNPNNEIQTLSISGNTVSLSNGGGSINLPSSPTSMGIISIAAQAMNVSPTSTIITPVTSGLEWTNSFSNAATIIHRKPADYDGGPVTLKIFFRTTTSTAGTVEFFIRPRSYNSGAGFFDASSISGGAVPVSGTLGFGTQYEQTLNIPANRLNNDWWYITIQRNSTNNTYPDNVTVIGVALEYPRN